MEPEKVLSKLIEGVHYKIFLDLDKLHLGYVRKSGCGRLYFINCVYIPPKDLKLINKRGLNGQICKKGIDLYNSKYITCSGPAWINNDGKIEWIHKIFGFGEITDVKEWTRLVAILEPLPKGVEIN
jgi:hypothetical protein